VPPTTCTGNNGNIFGVNDVEMLSCPSGQTGSASRTCQANGWGPTNSSTCVLPTVNPGDQCGADGKGYTAICPAGTECQPRHTPGTKPPLWCFLVPFLPVCQGVPGTTTPDWYCDP
jgi:hypothetical protein